MFPYNIKSDLLQSSLGSLAGSSWIVLKIGILQEKTWIRRLIKGILSIFRRHVCSSVHNTQRIITEGLLEIFTGKQTKVTCQNPGKHVMLLFEDN